MTSSIAFRTVLFMVIFLAAQVPIKTQTMWNAGQSQKEISLQVFVPNFKTFLFSSELSGTGYSVTGRIGFNETKTLVLQLPYFEGTNIIPANAFFNNPARETKQNSIGNLYIGLETSNLNSGFFTNFGVYLPTIANDKFLPVVLAIWGDPDQYESGAMNFLSIALRINNRSNKEEGFGIITRVGVTGMINTKPNTGVDDFEGLLSYAAQPTYRSENLDIVIGVSGRMIVTESGNLEDRIMHQAGFSLGITIDRIRVGAFGRIPLNKSLSDLVVNTLGGTIALEF